MKKIFILIMIIFLFSSCAKKQDEKIETKINTKNTCENPYKI
jgi:PBP1b-binding outer membrane lipoprotein LpoB